MCKILNLSFWQGYKGTGRSWATGGRPLLQTEQFKVFDVYDLPGFFQVHRMWLNKQLYYTTI